MTLTLKMMGTRHKPLHTCRNKHQVHMCKKWRKLNLFSLHKLISKNCVYIKLIGTKVQGRAAWAPVTAES